MEPLLYLTHRIPFPPNKGDKVRSFHLLEFLARRYRVHLATFVDAADDYQHVPRLESYCASHFVGTLRPAFARARSLAALLTGEPLTLRYYRDPALAAWVRAVIDERSIRKAVVFSSAMAQYVAGLRDLRVVVDFVDVDSAKWDEYARTRRWPLSLVYGREGERLLAFERSVAREADATVFVTRAEAGLFRRLAPECAARVQHAQNGVDAGYFAPSRDRPSPYAPGEEAIVFTGAMDYWPNVDAVRWFAADVLPRVWAAWPQARFYIVGMQPVPAVLSLARDARVVVTGRVPDVRPYLQHARVVVAPLRVARGIQNKVLEAMAMGRPVVASTSAATALDAVPGEDLAVVAHADGYVDALLASREPRRAEAMGLAARARVLASYDWSRNLAPFAELLADPVAVQAKAG